MSSRILVEEMGGLSGLLNALESDSKVSERPVTYCEVCKVLVRGRVLKALSLIWVCGELLLSDEQAIGEQLSRRRPHRYETSGKYITISVLGVVLLDRCIYQRVGETSEVDHIHEELNARSRAVLMG